VGQHQAVDNAIPVGGHVLLIGEPALAKTLLIATIAQALDVEFSRIQFTPNLMSGDTGRFPLKGAVNCLTRRRWTASATM